MRVNYFFINHFTQVPGPHIRSSSSSDTSASVELEAHTRKDWCLDRWEKFCRFQLLLPSSDPEWVYTVASSVMGTENSPPLTQPTAY
jgi:hypothetical protein